MFFLFKILFKYSQWFQPLGREAYYIPFITLRFPWLKPRAMFESILILIPIKNQIQNQNRQPQQTK